MPLEVRHRVFFVAAYAKCKVSPIIAIASRTRRKDRRPTQEARHPSRWNEPSEPGPGSVIKIGDWETLSSEPKQRRKRDPHQFGDPPLHRLPISLDKANLCKVQLCFGVSAICWIRGLESREGEPLRYSLRVGRRAN